MQLKTIQELKRVCEAMPHMVGGLVLTIIAYESIMPSAFLTSLKSSILAFGGSALFLSGMGILVLDSIFKGDDSNHAH